MLHLALVDLRQGLYLDKAQALAPIPAKKNFSGFGLAQGAALLLPQKAREAEQPARRSSAPVIGSDRRDLV